MKKSNLKKLNPKIPLFISYTSSISQKRLKSLLPFLFKRDFDKGAGRDERRRSTSPLVVFPSLSFRSTSCSPPLWLLPPARFGVFDSPYFVFTHFIISSHLVFLRCWKRVLFTLNLIIFVFFCYNVCFCCSIMSMMNM